MKRPACGQCQKLGLKCDGYERETVFINITAGPSSADDKHRLEQASPQVLVLPDALARSAYEEKYLGIFWGIYLPQQKQFPPHVTRYTGGGWTNALPQLCSVSPPIRKVLLALCLTTAGRAETKSWEKDEGLRCYMSSLRDMSGTLARLKTADPTTLCVASRLYSLYEVSYFDPSSLSLNCNFAYSHGYYRSSLVRTSRIDSPRPGTGESTLMESLRW